LGRAHSKHTRPKKCIQNFDSLNMKGQNKFEELDLGERII